MKNMVRFTGLLVILGVLFSCFAGYAGERSYLIVDTGQEKCYDSRGLVIAPPDKGEAFYGQDAQYQGNQPSYTDNKDGTITDNNTGLMWQKSPDRNNDGEIDINDKVSYGEALEKAKDLEYAGYDDWRLPTIKELYSLINFNGTDPIVESKGDSSLVPFIDTDYFDFAYGDVDAGERIIDSQYASSTVYVGKSGSQNDESLLFGVNFADGRIKGYGLKLRGEDKTFFVIYVRGNTEYGENQFADNGDRSITDKATGLMWSKDDSGTGMNWEEALAWVQEKNQQNYLGYSDWRLPNAKELQSIVDYSRSPDTTDSAAIDPVFNSTTITDEMGKEDHPFYWTGTTHANASDGKNAVYVAFGEALGYMPQMEQMTPVGNSKNEEPSAPSMSQGEKGPETMTDDLEVELMDVHGAGAQRSDPKMGDAGDYETGHGPQGDVIRIYNFVRIVRDVSR